MLLAAVRRSITGFWNTIAWRRISRCGCAWRMLPAVGARRPMASLMSVVLPEPLGPISTVGGPASSDRLTLRRMQVSPAVKVTVSKTMGSVVGRSRIGWSRALSGMALGPAAHRPGHGVDHEDHGDQHQAEADRERQVALGGLERDGGG